MDNQNAITGGTRDGNGQYTRGLPTAEQDAEAARLHAQGHTYRQIAETMGIGLATAYNSVQRAMDAVIREPAEAAIANSLRNLAEERARLGDVRATVEALLGRGHVTVSQGHVVYGDDGEAVPDDEFTLKVVDRLMKIDEQLRRNDESRRRLEGLDQPAKQQISGGVTYQVVGVDPADLS